MKAETGDTGRVVVLPIGPGLIGARIARTSYWVETDTLVYVLSWKGRKPLDVTIGGTSKFAVEGQNGFILDDAGKEVKLPIVQKIAKSDGETPERKTGK